MQHLEVSGAVRPLKWSLGVKWLMSIYNWQQIHRLVGQVPGTFPQVISASCMMQRCSSVSCYGILPKFRWFRV